MGGREGGGGYTLGMTGFVWRKGRMGWRMEDECVGEVVGGMVIRVWCGGGREERRRGGGGLERWNCASSDRNSSRDLMQKRQR